MAIKLHRKGIALDRNERIKEDENLTMIEKEFDSVSLNNQDALDYVSNEAFSLVVDSAALKWQEPVQAFADLATAYPAPEEGFTAMTKVDGAVYRFTDTAWKQIQQIDAGPVNELDTRLTGQLADTSQNLIYSTSGLEPIPASGVSVSPVSTDPSPLGIIDGWLIGQIKTQGLYRKDLSNGAWEFYTSNLPIINATIFKLIPTIDGEMLIVYASDIFKSQGWQTDTLTWNLKLQPHGATSFNHFTVDGDGSKFIATSYSGTRADSRYVHISTDAGATFNLVYDSVAKHGQVAADASHLHGVCYDKYRDRFYLAEGHGADIAGVYCSVDNGQTWVLAEGMKKNASPTTITATPAGLVCGSDSSDAGVFGVVSLDDITKQELTPIWQWDTSREGLVGFAYTARYDEINNLVFIGFTVDFEELSPVIVAGTPFSAGLVYSWKSSGTVFRRAIDNIVTYKDKFWATGFAATDLFNFEGKLSVTGVKTYKQGRSDYGRARVSTSIAIGNETVANGLRSTLIGHGINQTSETASDMVAIGYKSIVLGTGAVSIGANSESQSTSVAIGNKAKALFGTSVAIGENAATSGGAGSVAIGRNAAGRPSSVAIGLNASNIDGSVNGVAIGEGAVSHSNSVAIGQGVSNTLGNQFAIGKKHFEIGVLADAPANNIPTGFARLFFRTNASSKTELCAQFPGVTASLVIATQP